MTGDARTAVVAAVRARRRVGMCIVLGWVGSVWFVLVDWLDN